MRVINKIALALVIIGALVWGMVGLFNFNLVEWLFSGNLGFIARIIYTLVGISGVWCISLLFYSLDENEGRRVEKYENFHTGSI
ncbi:MAG: DUF378 domain-containing protein [Clostridia bacterium]|nr:DUF378 domain-containing protein [Clostridia bacterium]